jgi:hypothetical protein
MPISAHRKAYDDVPQRVFERRNLLFPQVLLVVPLLLSVLYRYVSHLLLKHYCVIARHVEMDHLQLDQYQDTRLRSVADDKSGNCEK